METDNLEIPQKGCLYQVKKNPIKRRIGDGHLRPLKQGWKLVLGPRKEAEVYPDEVFMVTSNVRIQQLDQPGCKTKTYWIVDFIWKDRLWEEVWFTPVKWHVMLEKVTTDAH